MRPMSGISKAPFSWSLGLLELFGLPIANSQLPIAFDAKIHSLNQAHSLKEINRKMAIGNRQWPRLGVHQCGAHGSGGLPPLRGIFAQGSIDDFANRRRKCGARCLRGIVGCSKWL